MKPITYWLQNEAIEALIEAYGEYLQKLTANDRRLLIAALALSAVAATNDDFRLYMAEFDETAPISNDLNKALDLVFSLTEHEGDLLITAIASNLCEQENPWLQGAIKMLDIEKAHKKTDTPPLRDIRYSV